MSEYIKRDDALKIIDNYTSTVTDDGKIVADAIRDIVAIITPRAEVVLKSEIDYIFFELELELRRMLPLKITSLINGEPTGNSYDMGKERALYDAIRCIDELRKKHTEGTLWVKSKGEPPWAYHCNKCGYSKEPGKMFPNFCPNCHRPMLRREES